MIQLLGRGLFLLGAASIPFTPLAAQPLGAGGAPDISFVRVFLALLVCLIVAILAALFIRQRLQGGARLPLFTRLGSTDARLQLLEARRVAPQSDLCLIACDGEEYLVLIAPGGATMLDRRPARDAEVRAE